MAEQDEERTMREILRSVETQQIKTITLLETHKEKLDDHEARLRTNEKDMSKLKNGLWGILVASGTGLLGGIKALFGGH